MESTWKQSQPISSRRMQNRMDELKLSGDKTITE